VAIHATAMIIAHDLSRLKTIAKQTIIILRGFCDQEIELYQRRAWCSFRADKSPAYGDLASKDQVIRRPEIHRSFSVRLRKRGGETTRRCCSDKIAAASGGAALSREGPLAALRSLLIDPGPGLPDCRYLNVVLVQPITCYRAVPY